MKITYLFLILLSLLSISLKEDREQRNKCNYKYDNCKTWWKYKEKDFGKCRVDCYEKYKKCLK